MTQRVLFDATRLLHRGGRRAPTGVDRVCLAYAEWLVSLPGITLTPVRIVRDQLGALEPRWFAQTVAQLRARWSGSADEAPAEAETRLIQALRAPQRGRSLIGLDPAAPDHGRQVLQGLLRGRPLPRLRRGDLYVNVGHTGLNSARVLGELTGAGVAPLILIHDLIPISHPEFCRPGEAARHRTRMRVALRHAARIVVNSAHTGDQLSAFAAREEIASPPVLAEPLGLEPRFLTPGWTPAEPPYFVHVGTLEARKNLAFLLTLWRRLEESMGHATPRLVLIGRQGWENEAVMDHLERSPNLQGLVHQAADLPDAALARLMRGARAVLAPSSEEGFDLPAVEAMAMGVPLIASDIAVHRELVSGARLIDPLDGPGWMAAIAEATATPAATPGPAPSFTPPTWPVHFEQVAAFANLPQTGKQDVLRSVRP